MNVGYQKLLVRQLIIRSPLFSYGLPCISVRLRVVVGIEKLFLYDSSCLEISKCPETKVLSSNRKVVCDVTLLARKKWVTKV